MAAEREKEIHYESIPGIDSGETCLTIYRPGGFINNVDYAVFVGGCGVGHKETLAEAKAWLLERAKAYAQRRINEAQREVNHYTQQLIRLEVEGLKRKRS